MLKCRDADDYKAMRAPRCNRGKGCEACNQRWHGKVLAVARRQMRMHSSALQRLANN